MLNIKLIGKRIRECREKEGVSQEKLAELVSLSPHYLSAIERGIKLPSLETFIRIANQLGVSADTLLLEVMVHDTES